MPLLVIPLRANAFRSRSKSFLASSSIRSLPGLLTRTWLTLFCRNVVFLGYHTNPKSPWHVYPVVKVGDWGLASLTNSIDPANPHKYIKNGTAMYLPPVSHHLDAREIVAILPLTLLTLLRSPAQGETPGSMRIGQIRLSITNLPPQAGS